MALAPALAGAQLHQLDGALDCVVSGSTRGRSWSSAPASAASSPASSPSGATSAFLDLADVLTDDPALSSDAADCAPAVAVGLLSAALSSGHVNRLRVAYP